MRGILRFEYGRRQLPWHCCIMIDNEPKQRLDRAS
jgi:hypothetical protein